MYLSAAHVLDTIIYIATNKFNASTHYSHLIISTTAACTLNGTADIFALFLPPGPSRTKSLATHVHTHMCMHTLTHTHTEIPNDTEK